MDYRIGFENLFRRLMEGLKMLFIPFGGNNWTPQFISSKILFYGVVLVLVFKISAACISLPLPSNWFFADITKVDLLNLLNQNRQSIGLVPLTENEKLDKAAMLKAQDMIAHGYFAHQSPEGVSPWHWFKQAGYPYKYAGENLAVGFINSDEVFNAWMNSPTHKANLDNPNYRDVGTAIVSGFQGNSTIIVQVFGSAQTASAAPTSVAPMPSQPIALAPVSDPKPAPATTNPVSLESQDTPPTPDSAPKDEATLIDNGPEVLAGQISIAQVSDNRMVTDSVYAAFINFLVYDYQKIATYLILILLIIVSLSSLLNVLVNFNVQRGQVIAVSLALVAILFSALIVTPESISQIIPHQITI